MLFANWLFGGLIGYMFGHKMGAIIETVRKMEMEVCLIICHIVGIGPVTPNKKSHLWKNKLMKKRT